MTYMLKWMQHRDGGMQPAEHVFDDLDEAKEFGGGLGEACQAKVFDADTDEQVWPKSSADTAEQVWPKSSDKESAKQREASSMQNIKTPAGTVDSNEKVDTRNDPPEDLRKMAGATTDPSPSTSGLLPSSPLRSAAKPKLEADAGDGGDEGAV